MDLGGWLGAVLLLSVYWLVVPWLGIAAYGLGRRSLRDCGEIR